MKVAIIDLGSNSARMTISKIEDGKAEIINSYRKIVRLSEGMGDEKTLKPEAVRRTLEVLKDFKKIIDENKVDVVRAIATAALRTAKNRELFTLPVKDIGFEFEIISGEEEAYFDYLSVVNTLDISNCLIIDIGGASTELICVENGKNTHMASIPMAAVNMTEKYFTKSVADDFEMKNAVGAFSQQLDSIKWLGKTKNFSIVGLGGTVRALASLDCADVDELHGFSMCKNLVFEKINELIKTPVEKRALIDAIGIGRADIILGGVVPVLAIMDYIDSPSLIACLAGLREGVMYDIAKK